MKLAAKTVRLLSLVLITSGLSVVSESELSPPDYASAAVLPPGPSQKKVIVKNLWMV